MSSSIPRVNFRTLSKYSGRKVLIVGSVVDRDSLPLQITTTDKKHVTIHMNGAPDPAYVTGKYVEVTGMANHDNSIQHESVIQLKTDNPDKPDIDPECWEKLIEISEKHPDIF